MTNQTIERNSITVVMQELPINWKWMLLLGIVMILFGTVGLIASNLLTIASIYMLGALLLAGGIMQLIHGIQQREKEWAGRVTHWLIALLYIAMGALMVWDPFASSFAITVFIAVIFALIGIIRLSFAFTLRAQGWRWLLPALLGVINLVLAGLIIAALPEAALWFIGLLIAIEMLMNGWFLLLLALRVKALEN